MNRSRCLACYKVLSENETDYHLSCCRAFFGTDQPPISPDLTTGISDLAEEAIRRSISVTGVQPKLSMELEKIPGDPKRSRLTIVGLWGSFILKPPASQFSNLPENEDLTMHLAALFGIDTAEHCLIKALDGRLAYITKRFDRMQGKKIPMEDFCQITETQTSDKYRGSVEKVGRHLHKYATEWGNDSRALFNVVFFSFLTGNSDMHLKNYSMITHTESTGERFHKLSPAYDLLCTQIAMPGDTEESALTINAKKRKLGWKDFEQLGRSLKIPERVVQTTRKEFQSKKEQAVLQIHHSFLPIELQKTYTELFEERWQRIFG